MPQNSYAIAKRLALLFPMEIMNDQHGPLSSIRHTIKQSKEESNVNTDAMGQL